MRDLSKRDFSNSRQAKPPQKSTKAKPFSSPSGMTLPWFMIKAAGNLTFPDFIPT